MTVESPARWSVVAGKLPTLPALPAIPAFAEPAFAALCPALALPNPPLEPEAALLPALAAPSPPALTAPAILVAPASLPLGEPPALRSPAPAWARPGSPAVPLPPDPALLLPLAPALPLLPPAAFSFAGSSPLQAKSRAQTVNRALWTQ